MPATCSSPSAPAVTLYDREELPQVTGGTLRPGGIGLTAELLAAADLQPGCAVLDVGCGPGHTLALMAARFGLHPMGIDPSAAMLAKAARQAPAAVLLQGTADALPCGAQSFDGVISECVLSLTDDINASLQEMYRVLRPGGLLLLTDLYCKTGRPALPGMKSCLSQALPLEAITAGLLQTGFTLVSLRDRSDLLKQLAGQIIFTYGSLEQFWQLFLGAEAARQTSCALAAAPLGYYVCIAQKGDLDG